MKIKCELESSPIIILYNQTRQALHYYDGIGGCNGNMIILHMYVTLDISSSENEDNTV
jgi:hypothetical protein